MPVNANTQHDLNHEENARLVLDFLHRAMMHHALWFSEVSHQLGRERAYEMLAEVTERSSGIIFQRLGKTLGFEVKDGVPAPFTDLPEERLEMLKESVAVNWLANDGVWFQALENSRGMTDAKRCNDSCWSNFSPLEAKMIKSFLGLPERPGLDGLKRALAFRLYATVNKQEIVEETDSSFVFRMNECRVQLARKRKGLADYPCKSGGMAEYPTFAETIDSRIKTDCIACPPDEHPEGWFCAWKFSLADSC
ncbi:hypothetical protein SAMN02745165_01409 [Malonomonas rubra DSM 5091]|uniref:Cytosolic protein n=1 Tax=Malonomonas rubra DSM 5091 TaxID=1122189 RepID=A0A1M6G4R5_MALRU|nr:DUF6125 family protein [Malonomonas rubra]SHJ04949.1 hypothetical protein SAMN02745165_01409 [Malonomonas rubra DSM 5091]